MAKLKHHPGRNLGKWLHPRKGQKPMAMPPSNMNAATPAPAADPSTDPTAGASSGMDDSGAGDDQSGNVICTILSNGDGTYTLIDGDEDDGNTSDGSADGGGGDMGGDSSGQQYDSKGALLKAVLDLLNEDESSAGMDGSSDDQFAAGFNGDSSGSGGSGGMPMAQKY